jgi:hypothetical protein
MEDHMNFGKKVIFTLAGLGIAIITQPIGPIKIAIHRKNEMRKCIAEKRARVARLQKDIRKTLLAEWYDPVLTERLIVKPFSFKKLFPTPTNKSSPIDSKLEL